MPGDWKRPDYQAQEADSGGYHAEALASSLALQDDAAEELASLQAGDASVVIREGIDSTWVVVRWPEDAAIALRSGYWPEGRLEVDDLSADERTVDLRLKAPSASLHLTISALEAEQPLLRVTVAITPEIPLIPSFWPRDIYPLGESRSPVGTKGIIYATQTESAAGLVYASISEPGQGTFLYMQNLTSLNDYCNLANTNLSHCVGGVWPSIGLSLPPAASPIPAGREVIISDAFLGLSAGVPGEDDDGRLGQCFLDHIAAIYPHLQKPEVERHDWPARAEETLQQLREDERLTVRKAYGTYVRPYVDAEVPDSTAQLAVLLPALDFTEWRGDQKAPEFLNVLRDSTSAFFDRNVGSVIRYLPDVAEAPVSGEGSHDRETIDSWYLYHPMMQLANLAVRGNEDERDLFLDSLDYGIKVAHHFEYEWPIEFNLYNFEEIVSEREAQTPARLGETDVPGLYAYTMMDAFKLTGEERYLEEAETAMERLQGLGFEIGYQYNNVAWGMAAAVRLWQKKQDDMYLDIARIMMASIIHHCQLWESECGVAKHYRNFMGVNCLHDAAYSAPFEEFEIFLAFQEVLRSGGSDLPDSVRMLVGEYCRHLLDRAWYYYPSELPEEAIAEKQRQGRIDRSLAMPLEDLYIDGQQMGQVGQEVYGCGLAFILATRAFIKLHDIGGVLYCDYPILDAHIDDGRASVTVGGHPSCAARMEIMAPDDADIDVRVTAAQSNDLPPQEVEPVEDGGRTFEISGGSYLLVTW